MPVSKTFLLPGWAPDRFDLRPDTALLEVLTAQMQAAAPHQQPDACWQLPQDEIDVPLEAYLEPLNGPPGPVRLADLPGNPALTGDALANMIYTKWHLVPPYLDYLRQADGTGLLAGIGIEDLGARNWRFLDLDSLLDTVHLSAFCDLARPDLTVLEIGSGFGRLGDFLMQLRGQPIRHINIDAVPASIMWYDVYMRRAYPGLRVGTITDPARQSLSDFDIVTLPAWHLDRVPLPQVDLGINIESLQEMNQPLVDGYLALLDRVVRIGGHVALINSREHVFTGHWALPDHWRCLFRARTPRAWTDDYRTEIFQRTDQDCRAENALRQASYDRELTLTRHYRRTAEAAGAFYNPHALPPVPAKDAE